MDMSKFIPESHVAQQSRRDKLRIQQSSNDLVQHPDDFQPGFLHPVLNPDLIQVRNVRNANLLYDQSTFPSSNVTHFSENPDLLLAQRDEVMPQDLETGAQRTTLVLADDSMSPSILTHFNAPSRVGTAAYKETCGNWRNIDPQQACDLMVSYASGSSSREGNQNPFGGAVLSNNGSESNISATTQYLKPTYDCNLAVQSTSINPCSEVSSQDCKRHYSNLAIPLPQLYNSNKVLQDVVTTASVRNRVPEGASLLQRNIREAVRRSWGTDYSGNQSGSFHFDTGGAGMDRPPVENWHRWKGEQEPRIVASDATNQGLALSLSSNPPPEVYVAQLEEDGLQSRSVDFKDPQDPKILEPSIVRKASGKCLPVIVGNSTNINRHTGPLGPFTGYATILKNSRFLKPAQELLEDFCDMTNSKFDKICKMSEEISVEGTASASAGTSSATNMELAVKGKNSCASSSTFYSSNGNSGDGGLGSRPSEQPYQPDYQLKARLLYLQEEVCKRYKLYHQQIQMVVSSFESVAGLSAATPYVSLALKTVVRNFRSLKNAISDQIKHISRALGEDVFSPASGTSSSKGDMNKLKYMGQKSGGVSVGFLEPQQHGWRPQRGLPERAVAILRAWLFDHFLHPYPTDTDKHMLATQTGLTRNQVSNWFINARVRVWKPMVEEIHMLESKGLAEANQINSSRTDMKSASEGTGCQITDDQAIVKPSINSMSDRQLGSSNADIHQMLTSRDACSAGQWNQEKRSRVDFHVPTSMDGSLISFVPYQRSQLEMGGLGTVSLTLGLRHGVDSARQQQQQQFHQQEDQLRRQLGGQMIHDFVG